MRHNIIRMRACTHYIVVSISKTVWGIEIKGVGSKQEPWYRLFPTLRKSQSISPSQTAGKLQFFLSLGYQSITRNRTPWLVSIPLCRKLSLSCVRSNQRRIFVLESKMAERLLRINMEVMVRWWELIFWDVQISTSRIEPLPIVNQSYNAGRIRLKTCKTVPSARSLCQPEIKCWACVFIWDLRGPQE